MKKFRILIAEDNVLNRENLVEILSEEGREIVACSDGKEAMEAFVHRQYDLVVTDLKMPHMSGLELLKFLKERYPETVVVVITGYASVSSAVEAMKLGAFDYITKPIKDDRVKLSLQRALSFAQLKDENEALKDQLRDKFDFGKIIGYSSCMHSVFAAMKKVAVTDSTVIIYGESGTGKELVARALHFNSERRAGPLITVNCGAIPEELLESEMFGHEKGAFTGAIRSRTGRFELAQGGSIFLDEIGDMSPSLQVKLLRVIQEKQFEKIGGVKTVDADVRIIAATNQNLEQAVKEKRFREDLFYRINVIPIYLPPLRERKEDIPVLIEYFIDVFRKSKNKNIYGLTKDAAELMLRYQWPGNVRELQNVIEMLVVMKGSGSIDAEDLPDKIRAHEVIKNTVKADVQIPDNGFDINIVMSDFEKDLLIKALKKAGGIKNKAAKLLNLNRTTYVEKLKRYQIH
ncbi:MAG: sigma-54 dependent transcriptional regulator [Syntrophales bacterium]|jgi:DNA-binding NtrC family response regulator|nr:sigma-54 dependent transcriptional regulator [Syntrophales bacterium]MDY0044276.1 sigma-54 dependent transcriptional regulator [Syntrophales bacterium]